jgi:hypothetical protein
MADDAQPLNRSLSQRLYLEQGWRQGSVFTLDGVSVLSNKLDEERGVSVDAVSLDGDELLVLVTQDCDLVADGEANIEALACREQATEADRARLRNVVRESAREFVLDWERGWVADARRRVMLDKHALALAKHLDWDMPAETRRDFSNWLAWRFTRPAVEAAHVRGIQDPIKDALQKLEKSAGPRLAAFAEVTKELRIRYPGPGETDAVVLLIIEDGGLTGDQADAIDFVCDALEQAVAKKGSFRLIRDLQEYSDVLLRAFEASQPLRFDYLTRWGDELVTPTGVLRAIRQRVEAPAEPSRPPG